MKKRFQVEAAPDVPDRLQPNANVSHGEYAPVITNDDPGTLQLQQFGFTPRWAKKQFYMINARSEGDHNPDNDPRYTGAMGILQKPMFRQSIRDRRCLIIADAIIEGPRQEKLTKPYLVYARNGIRPFALAGIWDEWVNPSTGEITRSFAILTTVSNRLMERIGHHRSPVMLHEKDEQTWINSDAELQDITALLRPYPEHFLNAYPISPAIRDPRANGSDLLQPIGQRVHPEHDYSIHQDMELFGMGDAKASRRNSHQLPGGQGALFD